ncbi:MAG: hypothetical protein WED34_00600 [Planctomycetales bacterium]
MLARDLPLWADVSIFLLASAVIGVAGAKMAGYADRIADRTGLGEAVTGMVFLGLLTALPGLAASVTAALQGHPALAISNAMGGIAMQTVALAIADIAYRKANLEHAAASAANMMQAAMLVLLLTIVVTSLSGPSVTLGHVHPGTVVLFLAAGLAFYAVHRTGRYPMWRPRRTRETVEDEPAPGHQIESLPFLAAALLIAGGLTLVAGVVIAEVAVHVVAETPISETVVGGLFMAVATSLPELVTCVAAVRRGALTLAVSNIVGGNFFDVLFVAAADAVYFSGSLYHGEGVGHREIFLTSLAVLLNIVLLAGLIYRQKGGPGKIGVESVAMLVLYLGGFVVLWWWM